MKTDNLPKALILGCASTELDKSERSFFRDANPLGFILFQRNCDSPEQVNKLVADLRNSIGREDAPVLIDQEGGRVQRLKPPHWRDAPPAIRFAELARESEKLALTAIHLNARLLAHELSELGITVDCAPVLDVPQPGADPVIGDRALGSEPESISILGRAYCEGLLAGAVLPVIKHIPGHGRANVDSHKSLPVVLSGHDELSVTDFAPFAALADMPWAMTAHVLYRELDEGQPATLSRDIIQGIVRGELGYNGLLVSDDLSMQALSGTLAERALAAIEAGCDVALHCNGRMDEMQEIAEVCPSTSQAALEKVRQAEDMRKKKFIPLEEDFDTSVRRLEGLLSGDASS